MAAPAGLASLIETSPPRGREPSSTGSTTIRHSPAEHAVLGLLAEEPAHGFALARQLAPGTPVGRILTVRRPLVYRALDRLVGAGLVEPVHAEPGAGGPPRTVHRITPAGSEVLARWRSRPVDHVRDLRIEFQLKLAFRVRAGEPLGPLVRAQREALGDTLTALDEPADDPADPVDLWRRTNAAAVASYLDRLEELDPG